MVCFRYKKLLIIATIICISTYFAVPRVQTRLTGITDPNDSARFRIISWQRTFRIIKDHPYFGVGFNTFRYAQNKYSFLNPEELYDNSGSGSDSSMLLVVATTGIIGSFVICNYVFYPVYKSLVSRKEFYVLIIAINLGIFVESQFVNSLFFPQILFYGVLLISVIFLVLNRHFSF